MKSYLLPVLLATASLPAHAAPSISGLAAKQVAPLEAIVTVTIARPTPLDMLCDAKVDLGDGASETLHFGVGDKHQKTLQHKYAKAGTYRLVAKGADKCGGTRETSIAIASSAPAKAAVKPRCPRGWSVVPDSQKGASYSCQAHAPGSPIKCEGGTKYFAEKGLIGCR